MDDEALGAIRKSVCDLDEQIPKEGALVQFMAGDAMDDGHVEANQLGYLRLGIEFMTAAFAPVRRRSGPDGGILDIDIEYLASDESEIGFVWFERRETLRAKERSRHALKDRLWMVGCVLAAIVLITLLYGGVMFWTGKLLGN